MSSRQKGFGNHLGFVGGMHMQKPWEPIIGIITLLPAKQVALHINIEQHEALQILL